MAAPFVSCEWLQQRLGDSDMVVLEVSSAVPAEAEYWESHIPGSVYSWWKTLAWDDTDRQFPGSAEMAVRLGSLGVGDDTTLVLVGAPVQFAVYVYWSLVMAGQEHGVVILDGGRLAWARKGLPVTDEVPPPRSPSSRSDGVDDPASRVGRDDVLANLGSADRVLVDMRSDEEYHGERVSPSFYEVDHGAQRGGRIPGAVHLFYKDLLNEDETLRPADELREVFRSAGVTGDEQVVTYCRLSHRASLGWLILTRVLGHNDVRIYDGSWTEWGSMVGMPVER